jgi:uncharacterized membrane protein HdeD (DUF308 family)
LTYQKAHGRARAFEIAKGIVFIIFAIIAFANPEAGLITLAIIFGLDLLIVHLIKLVADIRLSGPQKRLRETNVAFDSLAIAIGIIMIAIPTLIVRVLVIPIIIGLFIFGATRIANGGFSEGLSRWRRILTIAIGITLIGLAIAAIASPTGLFYLLAYLMAIVFLILGGESLLLGLTNKAPMPTKKPATAQEGEPSPGQIMEVPRSSNVLKLLTDAFGRFRKTGEKAKILPAEKEPSEKKKVLSYAQIRNIVVRSEQYIALYNFINKLALDEADAVGGWNQTKTFIPTSDFNAIPYFDNDDLLIQLALLDLRKEPIIIQYPAISGRYVSLEISGFDHYCKVPLSTTKGDFKKATTLLFYSKRTEEYTGQSVNGVDWYIEVDCDFIIALLRVLPKTIDSKEKIFAERESVSLTSMSQWLGESAKDIAGSHFPPFGKTQVEVFGTNLLEVIQFIMNHTTFEPSVEMDRAFLAAYEPLGVIPGKDFDPTKVPKIDLPYLSEVAQQIINEAKMKQRDLQAQKRMFFQRYRSKGKIDLETEYVQSIIKPVGLPSEEMLYFPLLVTDEKPFNALHDYSLHISKDELPPAKAWSVTMYDLKNGLLVPNDKNKHSTGIKENVEGDIEIFISAKKPVALPAENWLPINREDRDLYLLLRLYVPDLEKIKMGWKSPQIKLIDN